MINKINEPHRLALLIGLSVALTALGNIVIPRLAIASLDGIEVWSIWAVFLGLAGILAFADMGLSPGLLRSYSAIFQEGDRPNFDSLTVCYLKLTFIVWMLLCLISFLIVNRSISPNKSSWISAFYIFCLSAYLQTVADGAVNILRAGGRQYAPYIAKCLYYLSYIAVFVVLLKAQPDQGSLLTLAVSQLIAALCSLVFVSAGVVGLRRTLPEASRLSVASDQEISVVWRRTWKDSQPERLTKLVGLATSAFERPLLLVLAGSAYVVSFDLFQRVQGLATILSAALLQPLLSLLLHERRRKIDETDRSRSGVQSASLIRLSRILLGLGTLFATCVWLFLHELFFGVASVISSAIAIWLLISAALNLLTAEYTAKLYSLGRSDVVQRKVTIEMALTVIAAVTAWAMQGGELYLALRGMAISGSAIYLLIAARSRSGPPMRETAQ